MFKFLIISVLFSSGLCVCPLNLSVKLSDADPGASFLEYGFLGKENYYTKNNVNYGCLCYLKQCVRKCCSSKEIMNSITKNCEIKENFIHNFTYHAGNVPDLNFNSTNVHFFHSSSCPDGTKGTLFNSQEDSLYLQTSGKLIIRIIDGEDEIFDVESYCIDYFEGGTELYYYGAIVCVTSDEYEGTMLIVEDMMHYTGNFSRFIMLPKQI